MTDHPPHDLPRWQQPPLVGFCLPPTTGTSVLRPLDEISSDALELAQQAEAYRWVHPALFVGWQS